MHSNAIFMLRKLDATMPYGFGGIRIFPLLRGCQQGGEYNKRNNNSINLIINQTHSL